MSNYDVDVDYEGDVERWQPVASSSRPHNYVAARDGDRRELTIRGVTDLTPSNDVIDVWRPTQPIDERTSAVDRSVGLLIRQIPMALTWLILAITAGSVAWYVLPGWGAFIFGLGVFGTLSAATFIVFDRQERDYSGAGLERHRVNQAANLKRLELRETFALKRMALESFLDHLERKEGKS